MLITKLLFLHQFFAFGQTISLAPSSRSLKFDRYDGMCRTKNVPIRTNFKIIKTEPAAIYVNATLHVLEDIPGDPLIQVKLIRCRSKENLDTCEDFLQPRPSSYCDKINPNSFNPMQPHFTPNFVCPITKGTYYAYNFKVDLSAVVVFPLGNYYWKGSTEVKDRVTQRLLYCFNVDGQLIKVH